VKRLTFAAVVLTILATAPAALAEATRTWVSGVGDDANPCSRTAPCKTWAGAISKTAPGGEIDALDPGGFGAVTITKAITLNGRGTNASTLAAGTNGINVAAGASDVVRLEHLQILGVGTGLKGISYSSGKEVRIRDVEIYGFTPTNSAGIQITAASGRVSIDNSYIDDNYFGILASATSSKVQVTNSAIDGNTAIGVVSQGPNGSVTLRNDEIAGPGGGSSAGVQGQVGARTTIDRCVISSNHFGVWDDGGGTGNSYIRVSNSEITENDVGLIVTNAGQLLSEQNNIVQDNVTNGSFTGTFGPS
jgi:Right handed beta helix region